MNKKAILAILLAVVCFTIGYVAGWMGAKHDAFWAGFSGELEMQKVIRDGGLTQEGAERLSKLYDLTLYGYFTADKSSLDEELNQRLDEQIVDIIEWKRSKGFPIGAQQPFSQIKIEDGLVEPVPLEEDFASYQQNLSAFLAEHDLDESEDSAEASLEQGQQALH